MSDAKNVIKGSSLLLASNIIEKIFGLLSTLVLARILTPADFGVVALAMLALSMIEVFGRSGGVQFIVTNKKAGDRVLDRVWSVELVIKAVLAMTLFLIAPLISLFFDSDALLNILRVLSVLLILQGLKNPGLWVLERELNYLLLVKINLSTKFFSTVLTIGCAIYFQSYWALVFGHLIHNSILLILSYFYIKHRPSFQLKMAREFISYSRLMIIQEVFGFLKANIDTIVFGKLFDKSTVGGYHVTKYLAAMPSLSLIGPISRPLLAVESRNDDKKERALKFNSSFIILSFILIPILIVGTVSSEQIVSLLLGEQWRDFSNFLILLLFGTISFLFSNHAKRVFLVELKPKVNLIYELISFLGVALVFFIKVDEILYEILYAKIVVEVFLSTFFLLYAAYKYLGSGYFYRFFNSFLCLFFLALSAGYTSLFLSNMLSQDYSFFVHVLCVCLITFASLLFFVFVVCAVNKDFKFIFLKIAKVIMK